MGLSIRLQDQIALKQGLDIFSQLASLFLQATGNDLVACFGGDIVKMKGNLKPVLSDSIGPDDVGQADHRCFGRGCGDNQLDTMMAERLLGKKGQHTTAAEIEGRAGQLPGSAIDFLGAGHITRFDREADGYPKIIAQRFRRHRLTGSKAQAAIIDNPVEASNEVDCAAIVFNDQGAVASQPQIVSIPGIGGKQQLKTGIIFFYEQGIGTINLVAVSRKIDNSMGIVVQFIEDLIDACHGYSQKTVRS